MLADDMAHAESLKAHFRKAQPYLVNEQGDVAESVDILNGARRGHGPVGFAAALLPLLGDSNVGAKLRAQVAGSDADDLGYYGLMLRLFGEGWDQKRVAFDADGRLLPSWRRCE